MEEDIDEIDAAIAEVEDRDELPEMAKDIPAQLEAVETWAWQIVQDWRACLPQLQFHRYRHFEAGKQVPQSLWTWYQRNAAQQGNRESSTFRQHLRGKQSEARDEQPGQELKAEGLRKMAEMDSLRLPNGSTYEGYRLLFQGELQDV